MLVHGDCLNKLKELDDNSVDSLVTDPPAGIAFMGKEWDKDKGGSKQWIVWLCDVMKEALRVMKPGAHGLVWALPRTSHWTATALEDAGFEIRDVIIHLFGSGFPKSLDISKAIDKQEGHWRGKSEGKASENSSMSSGNYLQTEKGEPITPAAAAWQGFGTSLKPASEHWILIRKPCSERTVAANVLKHGTGAINVDASRISVDANDPNHRGSTGGYVKTDSDAIIPNAPYNKTRDATLTQGRFPANLVLSHNPDCVEVGTKKVKNNGGVPNAHSKKNGKSAFTSTSETSAVHHFDPDGTETVPSFECTPGCAVAELDRQSGNLGKSQGGNNRFRGGYHFQDSGKGKPCGFGDSGGASRFFKTFESSGSVPRSLKHECIPGNLVLSHNPDCVEVGVKKVKNRSGSVGGHEASSPGLNTYGGGYNRTAFAKHGDSDGTETVPSFECTPGCAVAELDRQSGALKSGGGDKGNSEGVKGIFGRGTSNGCSHEYKADSGGASRFFYCAKASKSDKGEDNTHPTVKATKLMSYLITMITPPNGLVLDPFMGSGSTGVAALKSGFRFLGIEKELEYFQIAESRIINTLAILMDKEEEEKCSKKVS